MAKITLHNYLKSLSSESKDEEIKKLYTLFNDVKEYFEVKLSDSGEDILLEKYSKIIHKEFQSDNYPGRARLGVARNAVNAFLKISTDPQNQAELMIQYVEAGIRFTNAYGDIDDQFYTSMILMLDKALKHIVVYHMVGLFAVRVLKMITGTEHIGWGFHDEIQELYLQYLTKP